MLRYRLLQFLLVFNILALLTWLSASAFTVRLPLWESTVQLTRQHQLQGSLTLSSRLDFSYQTLYSLETVVVALDNLIPFFPSWLKTNFWHPSLVYLFLSLPQIFIISLAISILSSYRLRLILAVLTLFFLIPAFSLSRSAWDQFVIKTQFNLRTPWSRPWVWIWNSSEQASPFTTFSYHWHQRSSPAKAQIHISCLGHYQLFVNHQSIYHGPNFAVLPQIYFDTLDLTPHLNSGENQIRIICQFIPELVHEYSHYPQPGLLIGGQISDGLISRNLADHRLWQSAPLTNFQNGLRLSRDAGYQEFIDFTSPPPEWGTTRRLDLPDYQPIDRPLPLLTSTPVDLQTLDDSTFDFGHFRVGYLKTNSHFDQPCPVTFSWKSQLAADVYQSQQDQITFPAGDFTWNQFSRRTGRYLLINTSGCQGSLTPTFFRIGFPFDPPLSSQLPTELDRQIYQLSLNTLINNTQDHLEDCPVRERAMYIGDAFAISRCLMINEQNQPLVKQMLTQFAHSQLPDGSFPAMTPSGKTLQLPDYTLQWLVWLDYYLQISQDHDFAREMLPIVQNVLHWAQDNQSPEGFIYNRHQANWWNFIDWTELDRSYQFSTPLQLWYIQALKSAHRITLLAEESDSTFRQQADHLHQQLIQFAWNPAQPGFVDSFDLNQKSNQASLVTNALAGKFDLFPSIQDSRAALHRFTTDNRLTTDSPFSQTWVIDWQINAGETDSALATIRQYWGAMVKDGATSVFEKYRPGVPASQFDRGSHSHAWGCGPLYLYPQILEVQ